jgi:hexosaminidase
MAGEGFVTRRDRAVIWCVLGLAAAFAACSRAPRAKGPQATAQVPTWRDVMPLPATVEPRAGRFTIGPTLAVVAQSADPAVARAAAQVAEFVRRATGGKRPVVVSSFDGSGGRINLRLREGASAGGEGYELTVAEQDVTIVGDGAPGLFYGVQTLRQMLPYWSEYEALSVPEPRTITLDAVHIVDRPRFAWRGAMLDVARHFFSVDEVKRYIDLIAMYKINRLHLHLADDQGWRIEIKAWPELTQRGGSTEVGGGAGGFYTQQDYTALVAYAAERFITIVPEIDMPGHTNAALSSYADLNCTGRAPEPYTGTEVGFSALCVERDVTYKFIDDVVGEIAAITPGGYFHGGGDEVKTLTPEQYRQFVERVQTIVQAHGKQMIGWDEVASATLLPTSIVQHWRPDASREKLAASPHLILSPANRVYLDMKYDEATALGLHWAGYVSVRQAYDWDPVKALPTAPEKILGIETPLWSETLANMRDVEFLAFPRLAAVADLAWAPAARHDWNALRVRLGAQAPRWAALGINFYRTPEITWR